MITVQNISKRFGDYPALHDINLTIQPGEFIALLGPSGSGKTTLLRIIAGLEFQDAGKVLFDGEDVSDRKVAERGVGFVFQHYALFRHMTVAENVGFGLSVRARKDRPSKSEIKARAAELLRLVQLGGLDNRYPAQLSGGQRQRVALARALAVEPKLLLLDEPFGALDAKVRKDLRRWLRQLHEQMGLTSIFVTHDQEEALELADRIVVMDHGVIEQVGTAEQVYMDPASPFVSDFVGEINRLPVMINNGEVHLAGTTLAIPAGEHPDGPAQLHFRPHDVELADNRLGGLPITISNIFRKGGSWRVEGHHAQFERVIEIDLDASAVPPTIGQQLIAFPSKSRIFAAGRP